MVVEARDDFNDIEWSTSEEEGIAAALLATSMSLVSWMACIVASAAQTTQKRPAQVPADDPSPSSIQPPSPSR